MKPEEIMQRLAANIPAIARIETKGSGVVFMQKLSGARRWALLDLQDALEQKGARKRIPPAAVVAIAMCGENGEPLFQNSEEKNDAGEAIETALDRAFSFFSGLDDDKLTELYQHALLITGLGKRATEVAEKK